MGRVISGLSGAHDLTHLTNGMRVWRWPHSGSRAGGRHAPVAGAPLLLEERLLLLELLVEALHLDLGGITPLLELVELDAARAPHYLELGLPAQAATFRRDTERYRSAPQRRLDALVVGVTLRDPLGCSGGRGAGRAVVRPQPSALSPQPAGAGPVSGTCGDGSRAARGPAAARRREASSWSPDASVMAARSSSRFACSARFCSRSARRLCASSRSRRSRSARCLASVASFLAS
jgi:hypothetical protein